MKKTVCILLITLLCLSVAACGKEKGKEKKPEIDLEYYTLNGQIPEVPFKLGSDPETAKTSMEKPEEEGEETAPLSIEEGENTVLIYNGEFVCSYGKDKEKNGISYMATLSTAYGFENGTIISQVKEKLDPYPYTERDAKEDELFFLLGNSERTILEYKFDKRKVQFVFEENALIATVLMDTNDWEY